MEGEDQEMEKENENGDQRFQDAECKCGQISELDGVAGQAITVLLVEDDPMTSRIVETLLKTCLYEGAETCFPPVFFRGRGTAYLVPLDSLYLLMAWHLSAYALQLDLKKEE